MGAQHRLLHFTAGLGLCDCLSSIKFIFVSAKSYLQLKYLIHLRLGFYLRKTSKQARRASGRRCFQCLHVLEEMRRHNTIDAFQVNRSRPSFPPGMHVKHLTNWSFMKHFLVLAALQQHRGWHVNIASDGQTVSCTLKLS